jgi:hypothetical protein
LPNKSKRRSTSWSLTGAAQTDAVHVGHRNEHHRFVRNDAQVVETARGAHDCLRLDAFDDAEPVIRVNDLVSDVECHVTPGYEWTLLLGCYEQERLYSLAESAGEINGNACKLRGLSAFRSLFASRQST